MLRHSVFAAAFLSVASSPAQAEDPTPQLKFAASTPHRVSVLSEAETGETGIFELDTKFFNDLRVIKEFALFDSVTGVVCEWQDNGSAIVNGKNEVIDISDVKQTQLGCLPVDDVPVTWRSSMGQTLDGKDAVERQYLDQVHEYVDQDPEKRDHIIESFSYVDEGTKVHSRLTRTWDISAETVCLERVEISRAGNGTYNTPVKQDWGCFPVANKPYFNGLLERFDIKPA